MGRKGYMFEYCLLHFHPSFLDESAYSVAYVYLLKLLQQSTCISMASQDYSFVCLFFDSVKMISIPPCLM